MDTIIGNFEEILRSKQIPLAKSLGEKGETFYAGSFQVTAEKVVPFTVAFQQAEGSSDVQIHYAEIAYVKDFHKKLQVLESINDFNEAKSGYYRVCLAEDGEIYLRLLTRTTSSVEPIYEMLVAGSGVVSQVLEKLTALIQ